MKHSVHLRQIRIWLAIFMAGLVLSGVTAFPLQTELGCLVSLLHIGLLEPTAQSVHLLPWIERVNAGLITTNSRFPFLAYGTDWLAFAHLVIAVAFIGPFVDPVRNKWVITFGFIACAGVIPLALIAGQVRGMPFAWRLIDCSFGVLGCMPLMICRQSISALERARRTERYQLPGWQPTRTRLRYWLWVVSGHSTISTGMPSMMG
jgi:hypothetical protein